MGSWLWLPLRLDPTLGLRKAGGAHPRLLTYGELTRTRDSDGAATEPATTGRMLARHVAYHVGARADDVSCVHGDLRRGAGLGAPRHETLSSERNGSGASAFPRRPRKGGRALWKELTTVWQLRNHELISEFADPEVETMRIPLRLQRRPGGSWFVSSSRSTRWNYPAVKPRLHPLTSGVERPTSRWLREEPRQSRSPPG